MLTQSRSIPASDDVAAALKLPRRSRCCTCDECGIRRDNPLAILENHLPHQLVDMASATSTRRVCIS